MLFSVTLQSHQAGLKLPATNKQNNRVPDDVPHREVIHCHPTNSLPYVSTHSGDIRPYLQEACDSFGYPLSPPRLAKMELTGLRSDFH